MITIELPYPPTSGGRIKSWNMLKYLSERHQTSLACVIKYGTQDIETLKKLIDLNYFFYQEATHNVRSAGNLIKSYIAGIPINVYRNKQPALARQISQVANDFDVILLDHFESAQFVPASFKGKVVFHAHNATYLMWERFTRSDAALSYRIATAIETSRIKRYERDLCRRADIVFAAPNDIEHLVAIGAERSKCKVTYHLGDDTQLTLQDMVFKETSKQLLYVGTLNWQANIDGLLWFFESIWPEVLEKDPDIVLKIVGKNPDPSLIEAAKDLRNIEFTGFVEDLEPLYKQSRVFIAPLRYGSGIKVKVLNAMCRGIPVVTTAIGAEGLDVQSGKHLTISNPLNNMSNDILNLINNEALWKTTSVQSREIVKAKYTWEIVLGEMNKYLEELTA